MTGRGHGTNARYVVDRCRCDDCRQANRTYERDRARKHRKGLVPYIPADPVRTHLRGLLPSGNRLPDGWKRAYATREAAEAAVSSRYTVTPLRDKVYDRHTPRRT